MNKPTTKVKTKTKTIVAIILIGGAAVAAAFMLTKIKIPKPLPLPDLVVESIVFEPWLPEPAMENAISYTITVKNQGTGIAGPFDVQLFYLKADNTILSSPTVSASFSAGLAPGAVASSTGYIGEELTTASNVVGVTADVDPTNRVAETNETNNKFVPKAPISRAFFSLATTSPTGTAVAVEMGDVLHFNVAAEGGDVYLRDLRFLVTGTTYSAGVLPVSGGLYDWKLYDETGREINLTRFIDSYWDSPTAWRRLVIMPIKTETKIPNGMIKRFVLKTNTMDARSGTFATFNLVKARWSDSPTGPITGKGSIREIPLVVGGTLAY